jgi:hypothetical protein
MEVKASTSEGKEDVLVKVEGVAKATAEKLFKSLSNLEMWWPEHHIHHKHRRAWRTRRNTRHKMSNLESIVDHITLFLDKLDMVFPVGLRRRELVETEIEDWDDEPRLEILKMPRR